MKTRKSNAAIRRMLALILTIALLACFSGGTLAESTAPLLNEDVQSPFALVYEAVSPSVVSVSLNQSINVANGRISASSRHAGSGVVVREGYVLTNYHVVSGANDILVSDGTNTYDATYVGGDASLDIALLHAPELTAPPVRIGNSDDLRVGDWALVIGSPLTESLVNTLTVGVISGLNRNVSTRGSATRSTASMIQTDSALNAGNSGGGVFNIHGELVGIPSLKLGTVGVTGATTEGLGMAIPINAIGDYLDDIIAYGQILYPRIGISAKTFTSPTDEPTEDMLPAGVVITNVEKDAPADRAGMKKFDIVTEADGQRVTSIEQLQDIIRAHQTGETVSITVYRVPNITRIQDGDKYPGGEYITMAVDVEILDAK